MMDTPQNKRSAEALKDLQMQGGAVKIAYFHYGFLIPFLFL